MEFRGSQRSDLGSGFVEEMRRCSIYDDDDDNEDDDELGSYSSDSVESKDGSPGASSDEEEVESAYKQPLKRMDGLEEGLPMRRGISKFYAGKSKSFTSLADAASSTSVKEFAKPESAFSRKQQNLLASKVLDKNCANPLEIGGLSKSIATSYFENNSCSDNSYSCSLSPPLCLPPLHPKSKNSPSTVSSVSPQLQKCSPWRSFSVSDLHGMAPNTSSFNDMVAVNKY